MKRLFMARNRASLCLLLGFAVNAGLKWAEAQGPDATSEPGEMIETVDGRRMAGHLRREPSGEIVFHPTGATEPVPERSLRSWTSHRPGPKTIAGTAPFQFSLGSSSKIAGRLVRFDDRGAAIEVDAVTGMLEIAPGALASIRQRAGESQVLREPFEAIDLARWSQSGNPSAAPEPHLLGERALRLPAGGSALTTRLAEGFRAGRLELAFLDAPKRHDGHRWYVDLTFRKPNSELATIRVILGWNEPTLAVETPGGSALVVQPLVRREGWRRLAIQFDEKQISISVDRDELAHGPGLGGAISELRLASEVLPPHSDAEGLFATIDDLSLVRFAEPSPRTEIDPSQDEIQLTTGDQLFGRVAGSDADRISFRVDERSLVLPWSEVSGIHFRRKAPASRLIAGKWARVDWQSEPVADPAHWDHLEGAIVALDDRAISMDVPYLGRVVLARDRLRKVEFLQNAARMVLDPTAHHLGDRTVADLDPPQAEAAPMDLAFSMPDLPDRPARISLDVVQVIGIEGTPPFSEQVKRGDLLTRLSLNGQDLGDLNRFLTSRNDTPVRISVPVPNGMLKKGANLLRLSQNGTQDDPAVRDNLGILLIAVEFPSSKVLAP